MRAMPALSISMPRLRAGAVRVSATAVWLAALTLAALALRLFWVFYTDTIPLGGDPHWYYVVGSNLAKGFGFVASRDSLHEIVGPGRPTAYWPPGYPFALAAAFRIFGESLTVAKVANAALGAATVPFVYSLGTALFDRRSGLAAAALFAAFPNAIAWTPVLFPEPLFTFLLVAALCVLVAPTVGRRAWPAVAAFGLLLGIAALTRGQGIVLLPVAMTYWFARWGAGATLRYSALAVIVAAASIAPWAARNAVELHAFIPISTNSASVLRIGHAPDSTGYTMWTRDAVDGVPMDRAPWRPDWEVNAYRVYPRRAIDYALTHPQREFQLSGLKLYHVYRSDVGVIAWLDTLHATPLLPAGLSSVLWYVFTYSYYVLFFAAVLSVPFWLRRDAGRALLAAVFVFWSLFHIVFVGDVRYHVPLYPFFAIAVTGGAAHAMELARLALAQRADSAREGRDTRSPVIY